MVANQDDITKLLSSASLVVVGIFLQSVSSLVERVIIGRVLSPSAYGEVSIGFALLVFGSVLGLLGFSQGVTRYTSRVERRRDARGVWASGLLVAGVATTVIAVVLIANTDLFVSRLFEHPHAKRLFVLFALCMPFRAGFNVGLSAIRGFENTLYRTYAQHLVYPVVRIGLLVAFLAAGFGILSAGYAYLASVVVAFVTAHLFLNRLLPLVGPVELRVGELARFSLPLVVSTVLMKLLTRTDTLMLGYFRTSYEVGQYSAAFPLAQGMMIVYGAFGFLYFPIASRLDAKGERDGIDRIYKLSTKWIFVATFPAFVLFALFSTDAIHIFFGSQYTDGAIALAVLSVGFFVRTVNGRNRKTLSALGHTKYILYGSGTAFLVNVALNLAVIPAYGIVGAAVASALSFTALNFVITGILWYRFDISPFSRMGARVYLGLPLALVPPAYLVSGMVTLTAATLIPFLVVVAVAAVGVVGLVGGLQPEDLLIVEFVEERVGIQIPYVRRFVPRE